MAILAKIRKGSPICCTLVVSSVLALGCGGESLLNMPSPHSRYDHNRTRPLRVASLFETRPAGPAGAPATPAAGVTPAALPVAPAAVSPAAVSPAAVSPADVSPSDGPPAAVAPNPARPTAPVRFRKADYAPQAKRLFEVVYAHPDSSSDGLPAATLVPTYPGLPLPLSSAPVEGCDSCLSDREDLIDFLATGSGAQAGVESPPVQGDAEATARTFGPLLDVLSRAELLALPAASLRAAVDALKVTWADGVLDARYAPAAFASLRAFEHRGFWFVLYQFPEQASYSRLVVVPTSFRQDICSKSPGSGEVLGCQ